MVKALATALLCAVLAGPALAGPMTEAAEICSDPMTTGPEKRERLPQLGWTPAPVDEAGTLTDLAVAHVIGFTRGMTDVNERFARAPLLAASFARLAGDGAITLWQKDGALLALSIARTAEDTEHVGCYLAMPAGDETLALIDAHGGPEVLPDLELVAARFDETAMNMRDDIRYRMYSTWTRLTSDPQRTPLTDAYRLERVELRAEQADEAGPDPAPTPEKAGMLSRIPIPHPED